MRGKCSSHYLFYIKLLTMQIKGGITLSKKLKKFLIETVLIGILVFAINSMAIKITNRAEEYLIISLIATLIFIAGRTVGYFWQQHMLGRISIFLFGMIAVVIILHKNGIGWRQDAVEDSVRSMGVILNFILGLISI